MQSLLFFTYLLLVPVGLIALGLWLMRYTTRLAYPPEKRILFTVIVVACLTFVAFTLGAKLNKWRQGEPQVTATTVQSPQPTPTTNNPVENTKPDAAPLVVAQETKVPAPPLNEEEMLQEYERNNFPELYQQRIALRQEINNLDEFFTRIQEIAKYTPKQVPLLQKVLNIRYEGYRTLKQRELDVSQHLREFWVHYNTGNSHDATQKFSKVAERLTKQIRITRGNILDFNRREERVLNDYMKKAGLALKNNRFPTQLRGTNIAYNNNNRTMLMDWLQANGPIRTLEVLEALHDQRTLINGRIRKIRSYQQRYPDLASKLSKTLKLWHQALDTNYYANYRLLYATEIRFIVDQLPLETGQIGSKRLQNEMNSYTELVNGYADDMLEKAEEAYQAPRIQ